MPNLTIGTPTTATEGWSRLERIGKALFLKRLQVSFGAGLKLIHSVAVGRSTPVA
jgi:hypothetical protein